MPDTITLFGETLSVTKKGRLRSSTVTALLRRRADLICRLTSKFDGMTDGHVAVDSAVTRAWVAETMLTRAGGTLCIYRSTRLGADVLCVSDACSNVEVSDAELDRRRTMVASLPLSPHSAIDTGVASRLMTRAVPLSSFAISAARNRYLDSCADGIAFDEALEELRTMTTWQELAAYVSQHGYLAHGMLSSDEETNEAAA